MPFISIKVEGLDKSVNFVNSVLNNMPNTRAKALREGADKFFNTAYGQIHNITYKTRDSLTINPVEKDRISIEAGYGAPFEEDREGTRDGTPHAFMTTAGQKHRLEFEPIVNKHYQKLLKTGTA